MIKYLIHYFAYDVKIYNMYCFKGILIFIIIKNFFIKIIDLG
jgi:hypothetical protein